MKRVASLPCPSKCSCDDCWLRGEFPQETAPKQVKVKEYIVDVDGTDPDAQENYLIDFVKRRFPFQIKTCPGCQFVVHEDDWVVYDDGPKCDRCEKEFCTDCTDLVREAIDKDGAEEIICVSCANK